jgi:hypothetical protein
MEQSDAQRFLSQLQEATYLRLGIDPRAVADAAAAVLDGRFLDAYVAATFGDLDEDEKELLLVSLREVSRDLDVVPSRYEDPLRYQMIRKRAEQIESAATTHGMELSDRPLLGTLPTGQVNAVTYLVPGSRDHVVLFERELFTFALLLSKAVCCTFPLEPSASGKTTFATGPAPVRRRIEEHPELIERFTEFVLAYALTGRPTLAKPYLPERAHQHLALVLRTSLELFVLGHEYGHVLARHLSQVSRTAPSRAQLDDVDALEYSWQQEYEADAIGCRLAHSAMKSLGHDSALSFWGADSFFSGMDVMDRATSLLLHGDEERQTLSSHPPSELRRERLRATLPHIVMEKHPEEHIKPVQLGWTIQAVIEELWVRSRPSVANAHKRGLRPARQWAS